MKRWFVFVLGFLYLGMSCAQYPSKPVKVVIPFPPGGPTDVVGSLLRQMRAEQAGQHFLIGNRAGGNDDPTPLARASRGRSAATPSLRSIMA